MYVFQGQHKTASRCAKAEIPGARERTVCGAYDQSMVAVVLLMSAVQEIPSLWTEVL